MDKILVIGSTNIDMMANVPHLPQKGETVGNAEFSQAVGGKGMNQTIAAARLDGDVTFVTALGNDHHATQLIQMLNDEGVSTDYIINAANLPTGTALIFVSCDGDNCIAVAPGANNALTPDKLAQFDIAIQQADIIVMQAEIPYDTIRAVAIYAHALGKKVMLNLAPARDVDPELLASLDVLVVNETEGAYITGCNLNTAGLQGVIDLLPMTRVPNIVLTAGGDGAYLITPGKVVEVPAFNVEAIDTIAAGDTFCGALAVRMNGDYLTPEDLRFAHAASAIAVTRRGATTSIPTASEVTEFIKQQTILNS